MRVPVVNVTLYLPGGVGTRYPAVVLASRRRKIGSTDRMFASVSASVVVWVVSWDTAVKCKTRLEKRCRSNIEVCLVTRRNNVLDVMIRGPSQQRR